MSFTNLPPEIIFNTLLDLPYEDIMRACNTSRRVAAICSPHNGAFWCALTERDFIVPKWLSGGRAPWYDAYHALRAILMDVEEYEATYMRGYSPLVQGWIWRAIKYSISDKIFGPPIKKLMLRIAFASGRLDLIRAMMRPINEEEWTETLNRVAVILAAAQGRDEDALRILTKRPIDWTYFCCQMDGGFIIGMDNVTLFRKIFTGDMLIHYKCCLSAAVDFNSPRIAAFIVDKIMSDENLAESREAIIVSIAEYIEMARMRGNRDLVIVLSRALQPERNPN